MLYLVQDKDGKLFGKWSVDPANDLAGLTVFPEYPKDADGNPESIDVIKIDKGLAVVDDTLKAKAAKDAHDEAAAVKAKADAAVAAKTDLGKTDASALKDLGEVKAVLDKILKVIAK